MVVLSLCFAALVALAWCVVLEREHRLRQVAADRARQVAARDSYRDRYIRLERESARRFDGGAA